MNTGEILRKALRLVYDLVDRLSSQKAVAEVLSVTSGHVSRLLSGSRKIFLDDILKILGFIEVSPRLVIEAVCEDPVTPVEILRAFRKGDGLIATSFLESVRARLPAPGHPMLRNEARPSADRRLLLELEKQREQDPPAAQEKLESQVRQWISQEPMSANLRTDIATALAIWASIQRLQDHLDDAATAYSYAFGFVEGLRDPWILGLLYRKVAPLLVDLKRPKQARQLLKEALVFFIEAGDPHFQAQVFVDLGTIHNALGEGDIAENWHALALQNLPAEDENYRFAVHYDLAWADFQTGKILDAQKHLAEARKFQPATNIVVETTLLWLEGDIWRKLGALDNADSAYRQTLRHLLDSRRIAEAIQVTLILAQTLLDAGRTAPLKELVLDLQRNVRALRSNAAASATIDRLSLAFLKGKIGPKLFEVALEEFRAALEMPRGRSHQS